MNIICINKDPIEVTITDNSIIIGNDIYEGIKVREAIKTYKEYVLDGVDHINTVEESYEEEPLSYEDVCKNITKLFSEMDSFIRDASISFTRINILTSKIVNEPTETAVDDVIKLWSEEDDRIPYKSMNRVRVDLISSNIDEYIKLKNKYKETYKDIFDEIDNNFNIDEIQKVCRDISNATKSFNLQIDSLNCSNNIEKLNTLAIDILDKYNNILGPVTTVKYLIIYHS